MKCGREGVHKQGKVNIRQEGALSWTLQLAQPHNPSRSGGWEAKNIQIRISLIYVVCIPRGYYHR